MKNLDPENIDRALQLLGERLELAPTPEEVESAARWALKHDPSPGFRAVLLSMIDQLGFDDVAERL